MSDVAERSFFDRTLESLRRAMTGFGQPAAVAPDLAASDLDRVRRQVDDCLEARGGEVSARARAASLGHTYLSLTEEGRLRFLRLLAVEYGADRGGLSEAVDAWRAAEEREALRAAERRMRQALVAPRVRLLRQFTALPQGVKFLVDLRAELLRLADAEPELAPLEEDLKELLVSWFDIGFLDLQRISWQAPAALLEKLIAYEAVHEIRSWDDLKNRLEPDRRCYAFFHPRMPEEPLIFVEVALVRGMADNVQHLLDETAPPQDPADADAAIFYSISNAQAGLAGVSFGDFLIKRVADALSRDLPHLKTFATLSPVPGFRSWLARGGRDGGTLFLPQEARALADAAGDGLPPQEALARLLDRPDWPDDAVAAAALKPVLLRLCALYLLEHKRSGRAADRVAHFHLLNGARLERINWLADRSANGMRQAAGLMVNYLYKLTEIERNHEAYRTTGKVAAASAVRRLLG